MYCKYCGTQHDENAKFCQNCGAELAAEYKPEPTPTVAPAQPLKKEPKKSIAAPLTVLILAIAGLVLAESGSLAFAGIILSAIALKKAADYKKENGNESRMANIGHILAIVGLVLSIAVTIASVISFFVLGVTIIDRITYLLKWLVDNFELFEGLV